jgi:hypothetical protein
MPQHFLAGSRSPGRLEEKARTRFSLATVEDGAAGDDHVDPSEAPGPRSPS